MEKLKIKYPIICEGKYDKIKLSSIIDGTIITTDGFGIFKNEEKASDRLRSVPKLLPALMRGEKVGKRAANVGFDFENVNEVLDRLKSEISELEAALGEHSDIKTEEELGDILFSCTNLARFLKKDSEKALTFAINKFIIRFSSVEALLEADGKSFSDATQDELNYYWEKAKKNTVV